MFDEDKNDDTNVDQNLDNELEDDLEITFVSEEENEDEDDSNESQAFRDLRKQNRLLQQQLRAKDTPKQDEVIELGEEPTLESCEYDEDKFKAEVKAYYAREKAIEKQKEEQAKQQDKVKQAQQTQLEAYETQKKALGAKNYKVAEEEFLTSVHAVNPALGEVILNAAEDMAKMVYVLGTQPKKLESLLKITNPYKLAAEVARIEKDVKVQKKQSNIKPEGTLKGDIGGGATASSEKHLEKLRAEAQKTGDFTKVAAYKRSLRPD